MSGSVGNDSIHGRYYPNSSLVGFDMPGFTLFALCTFCFKLNDSSTIGTIKCTNDGASEFAWPVDPDTIVTPYIRGKDVGPSP